MLSKETAARFRDLLPELLRRYDYDPDGPEHECLFCHRRPYRNDDPIDHSEDCLGKALERELSEDH